MGKYTVLSLLLLASNASAQQRPPPDAVSGKKISKPIRFLSPLQSLTLFPKEVEASVSTRRDNFLSKFKTILEAEKVAKQHIARAKAGEAEDYNDINTSEGWEKRSQEMEKRREEREEEFVDRAVDRAIASLPSVPSQEVGKDKLAKYQFVGVVQPSTSEKNVMWYARKRPANSKWNVRLLHVNREAIVHDLFTRGKVDIYGEYVNKPDQTEESTEDGEAKSTLMGPKLEPLYSVKERSWKNIWNFSPKHFFTDSSGAFWRERRLSPGLYTDGKIVYESRYRYGDGKNGMKPISELDSLLKSKSIRPDIKNRLMKRLGENSPDVVIEE